MTISDYKYKIYYQEKCSNEFDIVEKVCAVEMKPNCDFMFIKSKFFCHYCCLGL